MAPQFPINLVIPITTADEDKIVHDLLIVGDIFGTVSAGATSRNAFLGKAYYEHPNELQRARLVINGVEVKRGSVDKMREHYNYELGINQKTNITLQEWRRKALSDELGGFVTIASRVVKIIQ